MEAVRQASFSESSRGAPFVARELVVPHAIGRWYDRRDYHSIAIVGRVEGSVRTDPPSKPAASLPLRSGDIVFLRPADKTYWRPDSGSLAITHISFSTSSWHSYAKLTGLGTAWERLAEPPRISSPSDDSDYAPCVRRVIERFNDSPTLFDLVEFWTAIIPRLLDAALSVDAESPPPEWLAESLEAMREEENLRAGVARFAEMAHVSSGYLAVLTRRHFGQTPIGLVTEIRLQHACQLLRTTSDSVGEVAERCGFRDGAYFPQRFRREFGVSPRTYRTRLASIREATTAPTR